MHFTDRLTWDGELRRTADGYAVVSARVARAGNVQNYLGSEMGVADKAIVRVYRPAAEVFKRDAIASYAGVPITLGHPDGKVTADSWKALAVGEVGDDVLRDGEFVRVPMMLRDAKAIAAIGDGRRELSMGYDAQIKMADGVTPTGEPFDAIMSDFKMNHVAIVDMARGGKELRIGDGAISWGTAPITDEVPGKEKVMTLKTVTVDGIPIEVTDQGATVISTLQKRLADAATATADAEKTHQAALAAKDADLAKKDAEIDALKGKVLDAAALDKMVTSRAALITVAKAIAKDVKTDGLSDAAIRKAVVTAKLGDAAVAGKADAYIDARFEILAEDAVKIAGVDPVQHIINGGLQIVGDDKTVSDAYAQMVKDMKSGAVKAAAAN